MAITIKNLSLKVLELAKSLSLPQRLPKRATWPLDNAPSRLVLAAPS